MTYQLYGEPSSYSHTQPTYEIPVTPVEMLEKMAHSHRAPEYRYSPPRRMTQPAATMMSMAAADATAAPSASDVAASTLQELKQLKYILIGVAVLILLLLILRR